MHTDKSPTRDQLIVAHAEYAKAVARRTAKRLGFDEEEAESLSSLVLVRAVDSHNPEMMGLGQWIRYKVINAVLTAAAVERAHPTVPFDINKHDIPTEKTNPVDVENLLQVIPRRDQKVIHRVYMMGKTHAEVAAEMGLAPSTISGIVARSLQKMREAA